MPRMTQPNGDSLNVPEGGVKAMEALGWTVERDESSRRAERESESSNPERPRRRPGRPRKQEQGD